MKCSLSFLFLIICTLSNAQVSFYKKYLGPTSGFLYVEEVPSNKYFLIGQTSYLLTDSAGTTIWTGPSLLSQTSEPIANSTGTSAHNSGYLVAGGFFNFSSFQSTPVIYKTNSIGTILWYREIPGSSSLMNIINGISKTADGGYLLTGTWGNSISSFGILALKIDSIGNGIWSNLIIPDTNLFAYSTFEGHSVQSVPNGGFIISGTAMDPSGSTRSLMMTKLSATGNVLWNKIYNNFSSISSSNIKTTIDGGFIMCGAYSSNGIDYNACLLKTDSLGTIQWAKEYGSAAGFDWGSCVEQTSDGGYAMVGTSYSFSQNSSSEPYLIRTNASGDTLWTRISTTGFIKDRSMYLIESSDAGLLMPSSSYPNIIKTDPQGNVACLNSPTATTVNAISPLITTDWMLISGPMPITQTHLITPSNIFDSTYCIETFTTDGISELLDNNALLIYPNPASEWIQVEIPPGWEKSSLNLQLYSIHGEQLLQQLIQPRQQINISSLSPGIYLCSIVIDGEHRLNRKLVVQ